MGIGVSEVWFAEKIHAADYFKLAGYMHTQAAKPGFAVIAQPSYTVENNLTVAADHIFCGILKNSTNRSKTGAKKEYRMPVY